MKKLFYTIIVLSLFALVAQNVRSTSQNAELLLKDFHTESVAPEHVSPSISPFSAQIIENAFARKQLRLLDNTLRIENKVSPIPLIIIGEGGPSQALFAKAADTYKKEHGGEIHAVSSGDQFIQVMQDFYKRNGQISLFVYFGHGNHIALFVNQVPGVHASLYMTDPRLHEQYHSASILELPREIFAQQSSAVFYGCNIADGLTWRSTFAQGFADHFQTSVTASRGPTEFSRSKQGVDPFLFASYLPPNFNEPVYMVPSDPGKGFIQVYPRAPAVAGYLDVYQGSPYVSSIQTLYTDYGLHLDENEHWFYPYRAITFGDMEEFCRIVSKGTHTCSNSSQDGKKTDLVRNVQALRMLLESRNVQVPPNRTQDPYIRFAYNHALVHEDFVQKKWITREEMAELALGILQKFP